MSVPKIEGEIELVLESIKGGREAQEKKLAFKMMEKDSNELSHEILVGVTEDQLTELKSEQAENEVMLKLLPERRDEVRCNKLFGLYFYYPDNLTSFLM